MNETFVLQGRRLGPGELGQVRQMLVEHPEWSRYRLGCELARLWEWRNGTGQLKDMAARTLLLKLEERGFIRLPARRRASPNRMRHRQVPRLDPGVSQEPLRTALANLQPLVIREVSVESPAERGVFEALLHRFHYLSYRSPVGENMQYLALERTGRPVACVLFGAAAWQCADRDQYIGWDALTRASRLHLLTNNTRFLVMPWVESLCLASHVLGLVLRRLDVDWRQKYGHGIEAVETFVQRDRFAGTCYRAANWIRVGQTKGRTRQNAPDGKPYQAPLKDIYLFGLHPQFNQRLRTPHLPHDPPDPPPPFRPPDRANPTT